MDIFIVVASVLALLSVSEAIGCNSPQYLELGEPGRIDCTFENDLFGIFWYIGTNTRDEEPIINYKSSVKSGQGFLSGDYDVTQDGCLIMNEVSVVHDCNFTVITMMTPVDTNPTYNFVRIIVTVLPRQNRPFISQCGRTGDCNVKFNQNEEINCYVSESRPAVSLEWLVRTIEGDTILKYDYKVIVKNDTFTSQVSTVGLKLYPLTSVLLVCKAVNPPPILEDTESAILLQKLDSVSSTLRGKRTVERGAEFSLECALKRSIFFTWQVKPYVGEMKYLVWGFLEGNNLTTSHAYYDGYIISPDGTLTFPIAKHEYGGVYRCLSGDGLGTENVFEYNVTIIATPVPNYPIIERCNGARNCTVPIHDGEVLKCSVSGIWPEVRLEWQNYQQTSTKLFSDQKTTVKWSGDSYDINHATKINLFHSSEQFIKIGCSVTGPNSSFFDMHSTISIFNLDDISTDTETQAGYAWFSVPLVPIIIVMICCILVVRRKVSSIKERFENYVADSAYEVYPMTVDENYSVDQQRALTNVFVSEIQRRYEFLCNTIRPIPYIRDKMFCVNELFTQGQIEALDVGSDNKKGNNWKPVGSYQDIFVEQSNQTKVVEGDPGYGKSMLSLQLAYEWSLNTDSPISKQFDILILLRLRQLGNVTSLFQAIRRFILPKDSDLGENEIREIMRNAQSVLFIFDGYDEYHYAGKVQTDILQIISKEMFQEACVIVTTRKSKLPAVLNMQVGRFRLRGFDTMARQSYIRQAIAGDDLELCEKINRKLRENPIFEDLCETPLIFAMFAHMIDEEKNFSTITSATSFFRYIISCFFNHMRNKLNNENVPIYKQIESDHAKLDKLAVQGLTQIPMQLSWTKNVLVQILGVPLYNQYIGTGILLEEESLSLDCSSVLEYQTKVRFHHKLFCEWYAAHHVVSKSSKRWINSIFKQLQNSDVDYIYRFACGLNRSAAKHIIQILKDSTDGQQHSILCIMEQPDAGIATNVRKEVKDITSNTIYFRQDDSRILRRSTIQLLQIASSLKIPIVNVSISGCFSRVDVQETSIVLNENQRLPLLYTIEQLTISSVRRTLTVEEVKGIIEYAGNCQVLSTLRLWHCFLPFHIPDLTLVNMPDNRLQQLKVLWDPYIKEQTYNLCVPSGKWKLLDGIEEMDEAEYQQEALKYQQYFKEVDIATPPSDCQDSQHE